MAWVTVTELAKIKKVTTQSIYLQIKNGKYTIKKDEDNVTLVYIDSAELNEKVTKIDQENVTIDDSTETEKGIQQFFDLLNSIQNDHEKELDRLATSKDNEIRTIKESYDKIISMKDSNLVDKDKQIEELKQEIEKFKNKGFFQKLFG